MIYVTITHTKTKRIILVINSTLRSVIS